MTNQGQATNSHILGLDGLRGLAALFVYFAHSSLGDVSIIPWFNFGWFGKIGVFIFFLLSAFLISAPFLAERPRTFGKQNIIRYMKRRILRIYPLYTFYLVCALVTTWASYAILNINPPDGVPLTMDFWLFLKHLTLQRGDGVTWSIAVEFKFYFILPFIMLACIYLQNFLNLRWVVSASLSLCIAASALIFTYSGMLKNDVRLQYYLSVFLMGILCAVIYKKQSVFQTPGSLKFIDTLSLFCLALTIISSPPPCYRCLECK